MSAATGTIVLFRPQVRSIACVGDGGAVTYGMLGPGSHLCENVGRCHRSNHIFFVLDFFDGLYCQKCYDPDCCRFRSPWLPLPPEAWQREALVDLIQSCEFGDGGGGM